MKKAALFLAAILFAASSLASAQSAEGAAESDHYVVLSELGQDRASALSRHLEALFGLYEGLIRYDPAGLKAKLNVREFKDRSGFDAYLEGIVGQSRDEFVYLHYQRPERCELLVFAKPEPDYSASLAHQGFVQFLKAFVPNPPLWMREGIAIAFESALWDDRTGKLSFPENLTWLESAKSLKDRNLFLPLRRLLAIGQEEARAELDVFYPEAWAFVSFLQNSGESGYSRLLWDSIASMRRDAALDENQGAVAHLVDAWYGADAAEKAFWAYLAARKSFPELVALGVRGYADKAWVDAAAAFKAAQSLNASSYVPEYYLGLIAYARSDFLGAEGHYRRALQLGCESGIANYALGVNAFAQNRFEDAKTFLKTARDASPERYGEKVDSLVAKIGKQS